jgi:hypothetical protein
MDLGIGADFAQVIVGGYGNFGGAAQIGLRLRKEVLGKFDIGEGLPLAVDLNRNRVFVSTSSGFLRLDSRRGGSGHWFAGSE